MFIIHYFLKFVKLTASTSQRHSRVIHPSESLCRPLLHCPRVRRHHRPLEDRRQPPSSRATDAEGYRGARPLFFLLQKSHDPCGEGQNDEPLHLGEQRPEGLEIAPNRLVPPRGSPCSRRRRAERTQSRPITSTCPSSRTDGSRWRHHRLSHNSWERPPASQHTSMSSSQWRCSTPQKSCPLSLRCGWDSGSCGLSSLS